MNRKVVFLSTAMAAMLGLSMVGCSSNSESAGRSSLTENVGNYPPPPVGAVQPRVGVPPFNVQAEGAMSGSDLNNLAADQMDTLLVQSQRFQVIERTQLDKLLKEQGLEGIVKPGEMAKPAQVRGVDYLLIGKVTNLRVKQVKTGNSFGLGQIGGGELGSIGGAAVDNKATEIKTECGVDIRLVDPTTGEMKIANFSDFTRSDSASSMGLTLLGASASSDADIQLSEDDKGAVLRLALDDALRKSLPKIDGWLRNMPKPAADAAPVATPAAK